MQDSILRKLEQLAERFQEIERLLSEPSIINDQNKFRSLSQEYAQLDPITKNFHSLQKAHTDIYAAREMLLDAEMRSLAEDELKSAQQRKETLEHLLRVLLIPTDPRDDKNIFLEIRAGTGGDEAAIFAGDLFRMYSRYAENRGWQVEPISESVGEHGGYKEVISRIIGRGAYSRLKYESGVHRVQRVPATESQGRIHTSACTIAVLPEADEIDKIEINPSDLKVDTFRASGAGGQHVNKTDSAIRITHLPSGIVIECQDERSQHKNRARAMSLLKAKLLDAEVSKQQAEQAESRRKQVGTGDRSERIRTYNYPQGRISDHRINLTVYKLDEFTNGNLDLIIDPLISEHQAEQLATLAG